jgi:hypothetical protein
LRLLLDEMYSPSLAEALRAADIDACAVMGLGLAGSSDPEVFAAATANGRTLLTENVADFTRISADHLGAGQHHPGILIALSSRFSRRAGGVGPLVVAIRDVADQQLTDRVVNLQAPPRP